MINSPAEVLKNTEQMALNKYQGSQIKLAVLGILGGAFISLGGLFSFYLAYGSQGITEGSPGFFRLIQGLAFPIGLVLISLVGGSYSPAIRQSSSLVLVKVLSRGDTYLPTG